MATLLQLGQKRLFQAFTAISGSTSVRFSAEEGCTGNQCFLGNTQNPFALEKGVTSGWISFSMFGYRPDMA